MIDTLLSCSIFQFRLLKNITNRVTLMSLFAMRSRKSVVIWCMTMSGVPAYGCVQCVYLETIANASVRVPNSIDCMCANTTLSPS